MSQTPATQAQKQAKQKANSESKTVQVAPQAAPLSNLGIPLMPHLKELNEAPAADDPRFNREGQLAQDYVKGLKESENTALNTKEFVFYGYFQRIRARLDRAWVPILREKLMRMYRGGRTLASDMDHTTKVLVVLNPGGEIVRVEVKGESGNQDLDEAAVRAFNRAGPFPNPPRGIIDPDGEIKVPWEFILKT